MSLQVRVLLLEESGVEITTLRQSIWGVVTVSLAMYEVSSGVPQAFPALEMRTVIQMRA